MYFAFSGPLDHLNSFSLKIETDAIHTAAIEGTAIYVWGEIYNATALIRKAAQLLSKEIAGIEEALLTLYAHDNDGFAVAINGHFAMIIVDTAKNRILLCNDRFNSIPAFFYCSKNSQTLVIADDIKKIAGHHSVTTATNWEYYFQQHIKNLKATIHPTFAENIFLLNGGSCLSLSLSNFEASYCSYWDMERVYLSSQEKNGINDIAELDIVEEFRSIFMNAVKMRSTDADRTALLLSGGYDSGSIAIGMPASAGAIYTACTFNSILNNELDRAYDLAAPFTCDHNIIPFSLRESINPLDWCQTVWTSQNVNTTLDFFVKNQTVIHLKQSFPEIKYVLSGYGSDQLLGGTTPYDLSEGAKNPSWSVFFQKLVEYERTEMVSGYNNSLYQFGQNFFNRSYIPSFRLNHHHEYWLSYLERKKLHQTYVYNQLESQLCLRNDLLARYPFWDNNLVDLILAIPKQYHAALFFDKLLLRKAMKDLLPVSFREAPKFKSPMPFKNQIIYQFLRPVLYGNNYQLLNWIFAESKTFGNVFDKDLLFDFLKYNERSKYFSAYAFVLEIINMGLLDLLLQQKNKEEHPYDWSFQATPVKAKDRENASVQLNNILDLHRYRINYDFPVVKLLPIEVLRSEANDKKYLKVEEDLIAIQSEAVVDFINSIDGIQSMNAIVQDKQLNRIDIETIIHQLIAMGAIGFLEEDQ